MALGKNIIEIILDLYKENFFKKINSVLDMGDQDVALKYEEIKKIIEIQNIKFDENLWRLSKNFPSRPRVSTSIFWNTIGIKEAERMDIVKLKRDENDKNNHILHDLNFPYENIKKQYDLVTDLGNNEHPFNIVESYKTMHNLCKESGYMLIYQAYINGNGFYRFDDSTIDNIAAVNSYSIIRSSFIVNKKDDCISMPVNRKYLKFLELNNVDNVYFFYLLKKNNSDQFKFPYQGGGKSLPIKEFYTLKTNYPSRQPEQIYLPSKVDDVDIKILIKALIKKIKNKIKK